MYNALRVNGLEGLQDSHGREEGEVMLELLVLVDELLQVAARGVSDGQRREQAMGGDLPWMTSMAMKRVPSTCSAASK
eukprot:766671-Hanusia_phi.AAC.2